MVSARSTFRETVAMKHDYCTGFFILLVEKSLTPCVHFQDVDSQEKSDSHLRIPLQRGSYGG